MVVYHLYCCYNFLDTFERQDFDGIMIEDSDGFDDGKDDDEL